MLEKHFRNKAVIPKSTTEIAVAVSGGADSMCLVHLLSEIYSNITALIVDHGLRVESAKEAKLVKTRLDKLGVETTILKWVGKKPKSNVHQQARKARYALLTDYCSKNKIKYLFLAHTKNDQAETVMLRIYRGSGVDGITAMRENSFKNGIHIMRPLLDVSRQQIEAYLKANKVEWVDDPSNYNTKYERVKIRNLINSFEEKDLWLDRLCLLANNAQRSSEFIKQEVAKQSASLIRYDELGFVEIPYEKFKKLHEEIALKILVKVFATFSNPEHQSRLNSLKACHTLLLQKKDTTLAGVEIKHIKGKIIFIREVKAIKEVNMDVWDNRFVITNPDKYEIRPLTQDGWKQIKAKVTEKTWPHIKVVYALPAAFENDEVISCPLLGFKRSKIKMNLKVY